MKNTKLNTIEEVLEDLKQGKMVIVVDDDDREAEGDFICIGSLATPEVINFMVTYGRGLICTALSAKKVEEMGLSMMPSTNNSLYPTAFTASVDAIENVTTGISAADRSRTAILLSKDGTSAKDFSSPGHIFPLKAMAGGVLVRAGHTEAGVDLARLAGHTEAAVICEIMNEDGTMARLPELKEIAQKHNLKITSVNELIEYRRAKEKLVSKVAEATIPTKHGVFKAVAYRDEISGAEHLAIVNGEIKPDSPTNVRVHSECLTGDVFGSQKCDCGDQLNYALDFIAKNSGVILYLTDHEGRGIGLANKIKAYALQEQGKDTVEANLLLGFPADKRGYGIGAQILTDLGIKQINLLTNNPKKISGLKGFGLEIVQRIPIAMPANGNNQNYLQTKKNKLGHLFEN